MIEIDDNEVRVSPLVHKEEFPAGGGSVPPRTDRDIGPFPLAPSPSAAPLIDPPAVMRGGKDAFHGVPDRSLSVGMASDEMSERDMRPEHPHGAVDGAELLPLATPAELIFERASAEPELQSAESPSGSALGNCEGLVFKKASEIAAKLGCSAKTIHRRAAAQRWIGKGKGNAIEYQLPPELLPLFEPDTQLGEADAELPPVVNYTGLTLNKEAEAKVRSRERACVYYGVLTACPRIQKRAPVLVWQEFAESLKPGAPVERALVQTVAYFAAQDEPFLFSVSSLRKWRDQYQQFGINGLVEQKQGVVGRKPVARFLSDDEKAKLQADAMQYGSTARAKRILERSPELRGGARLHLHSGHASKSYVPPSVREAAKTSELTAKLAQGPKAAKLATSSVHSNPDSYKVGDVFVADDETPNIWIWEPWPNRLGYRLCRPQILQVADARSLNPLVVRVVMRHSAAYTADDVAGVLGDAFDIGLPNNGLLLEGGVWRGNKIIGHKTEISVEHRIGGLAALGLQVHWAKSPMAKWEIEGQFHIQQHILDACPGYCGRFERDTMPEKLKKQLARAETGELHPSEFLLSLSQFADHVTNCLREYQHERQDGKTLRGASPWEFWNDNFPKLRVLAQKDKWLYRSAMSVDRPRLNGELRVQQGTGRNQKIYYYKNEALLMPRHGQEITIFWNDQNPEADAVLLAGTVPNPHKRVCIGTASFVKAVDRFNAPKEQISEAMASKAAELTYARTELRAIEPHLLRTALPVHADKEAVAIGEKLRTAESDAQGRKQSLKSVRRKEQTKYINQRADQHPDLV